MLCGRGVGAGPALSHPDPPADTSLVLRRATPADEAAVPGLLGASLGWGSDERFGSFFAWKHKDNPFGTSPAWVAVDGEKLVGFRTFLRWELEGPDGAVRAVRAVDTATHPEYQRRGIFSRLTRRALEELRAEGVGLVFNTPNDRSGPGYLKLGWSEVGRLPVRFRPTSVRALVRMAGARRQAERWSLPVDAGMPATDALAAPGLEALLASQPPPTGLRTRCTPAFLAWRYGFEPLRYRAVLGGRTPADGLAIFRARRRGTAVEGTVSDVLVPDGDQRRRRRLLRKVLAVRGLDYVLDVDGRALRHGFLPLVGQAPTLYARALAADTVPMLAGWRLSLGDIELF